jgi:2,3-bisphosphoglycerate-dependent phosphoglycerate mutase
MERDNGPLAGLDPKDPEVSRLYPRPAFRGRYEALTVEGGESLAELSRRADRAIETLVRTDEERILVVSHGSILNAALAGLLGSARAEFVWGDTAFAKVLIFRGSDRVRLIALNHQPHLV